MKKEIAEILIEWKENGNMTLKENKYIPMHPELVYRNTGEWKGWADFQGRTETEEDIKQDELEDEAYEVYIAQSLN